MCRFVCVSFSFSFSFSWFLISFGTVVKGTSAQLFGGRISAEKHVTGCEAFVWEAGLVVVDAICSPLCSVVCFASVSKQSQPKTSMQYSLKFATLFFRCREEIVRVTIATTLCWIRTIVVGHFTLEIALIQINCITKNKREKQLCVTRSCLFHSHLSCAQSATFAHIKTNEMARNRSMHRTPM